MKFVWVSFGVTGGYRCNYGCSSFVEWYLGVAVGRLLFGSCYRILWVVYISFYLVFALWVECGVVPLAGLVVVIILLCLVSCVCVVMSAI